MIRPKRWRMLIEIHAQSLPLLLFLYALALCRDYTGVMRMGILCAVLHECGHLAVWYILMHRPAQIAISPIGIRLSMRVVFLSSGQELLLAAAGPCVNLILSISSILWMEYAGGYSGRGWNFASVNLLLGAFNLLPLPELDGAHIVRILLWEAANAKQNLILKKTLKIGSEK